jgi:hypothetical protein
VDANSRVDLVGLGVVFSILHGHEESTL